jgi:3-phenylpropionate/cinnamic acid dioxygenase small subunit
MDSAYSTSAINGRVLDVIREAEPAPKSTEDALERIRHREAIRNVLVSYCYYQDQRQWNESVSLFTEDCERYLTGTLDETNRGREELRAACGSQIPRSDSSWGEGASSEQMAEIEYKHLVTTDMIRLAGDYRTARLVAYCQVVATRGTGADHVRGAHEATYLIDFVNDDRDGWLMARQVILSDHASNPVFKQHALNGASSSAAAPAG